MSLDGAKLICLNSDDADQFDTILAHGKIFKFGYYMDCDVVLEHPDAMGLQCTIDCDAFGRVTIENRCTDHPITLDGKSLKKMRPLLHNTEICILDKKYLWQFEGNTQARGFQMEDVPDFTTPCKQMKKAEQAPNSEPGRRWRRPLQSRLTIHSFAYCIKAGQSPEDVEIVPDENKPLNIHERIADQDPGPTKRLSPPPASVIPDFIDLNTPKVKQKSIGRKSTPLSCCKLSETVITSYSPRETGVRQEKSFALVQSPLAITTKPAKEVIDVSLGPFQRVASPLTTHNHRPSMHLIDLTTPMKRIPIASSPARSLLKSTLKNNIPHGTPPRTPQKPAQATPLSSMGSSESVYSVNSTDTESVIVLSDDGSLSPSPVVKTPPRARTPQSLMKRAILSSAKKAAIAKRLLNKASPTSKNKTLQFTPRNQIAVRFQSQSTPQRKSLGRSQTPAESLTTAKTASKSIFTSTPFRGAAESTPSSSRRSLLLSSPSTSLGSGGKKESRTSLMLKQALAKTPTSSSAQKRKSVLSLHSPLKNSSSKVRKSVSFSQNISDKEPERVEVVKADQSQGLNHTYSIEENENNKTEGDVEMQVGPPIKEKPLSSQKEESKEDPSFKSHPTDGLSSRKDPNETVEKPHPGLNVTFSPDKKESSVNDVLLGQPQIESKNKTDTEQIETKCSDLVDTQTSNQNDTSIPRTPPSLKKCQNLNKDISEISGKGQSNKEDSDDDFDGLDTIFKTPKARNLMILSSPKSISLQKTSSDSVELIHSTEFDLSSNLDDIFKTPQSEFIASRVDVEETPVAPTTSTEILSPEEAFDMLIGRPILKKSYSRKTPAKKEQQSPLKISSDPSMPKTDIEEWIESVNESIELLECAQNEDELLYNTTSMSEVSRDPLMMSSIAESLKSTNKMKSPKDESAMTIKEDDEEEENDDQSVLKDPLQITLTRPISPNISGIGLLDHTSESIFSETLAVSDESLQKETEKTISLVNESDKANATIIANQEESLFSPDKARREMEEAFKNFENERRILENKRLASTPEMKKPSTSKFAKRRTMGNKIELDELFDPKAIKAEMDALDGQKNEESKTEDLQDILTVVDSPEYEGLEINSCNETLEGEPDLSTSVKSVDSSLVLEMDHDLFDTKNVEFENLGKQSDKEPVIKDQTRTLGSAPVPAVKLDLQEEKDLQEEMEVAFENFDEEPEFTQERIVKTPEPKKTSGKEDHRRTVGSALVPEVKLDLQAEKARHDMEVAFENFEAEPEFTQERVVKTPEPEKTSVKDHRRTLGSALSSDVKFDLKAEKARHEMEVAFENFEEEPEFTQERVVKTPEPEKTSVKDHRRTLGSALVSEVKLDLQAEKARHDMEVAFENFEDEPEFTQTRVVQTPEPKKTLVKDHRRTLGSALVSEVKLDLQAEKARHELQVAFENFEEEPEFSQERVVKTPEPRKTSAKDHRRTLGSALVSEVKLDLQAEKARHEMEVAFENFEDEPEFTQDRVVKTPEPKKTSAKDHRRTLGSALVSEVKLDLQAEKARHEMEVAFENFEEEPEFSQERIVKTPESKKTSVKDHRRTLGSALVTEVKLDLQAEKARHEMEVAFENFEEEPEFTQDRAVQTPEPKKTTAKDHRRTLGSALVSEVKLDLQAEKARHELQVAFENFEEEPEFSHERVVKTPEPRKTLAKDHRRTLGSALVSEVKLDLQAEKARQEMEVAFKNFEDEPEFTQERVVQTPEPKKTSVKDHRRTLGSALVSEVKLDLQAEKARHEMEVAFKNFEEEPEFSQERVVKTPEPKKTSAKDHRRTLGSALVSEVKLDLQAEKARHEMEVAFENFEDEPEFTQERVVQTPEPKKTSAKDHRRTLGSALVSEVKLDLQAEKARHEMEVAFENFEDEPEFTQERAVQTPEPKKTSIKDHRRTLGSALVSEVKLDLQAEKARHEMEVAFENFEDQPEFTQERIVQTPEPKKTSAKDHRRTLGSALVSEVKLDLQAEKARYEMEVAFENFEEEPEFTQERVVQTPEPKKASAKDHRRTLGSALVSEVKLDLQAEKARHEMEVAFENFEDEPEFTQERAVQTPEPKKTSIKDHRRTLGSALVSEVKLDLQAEKARHEMELAFENFEEEPEFSQERVVKTPEPKKISAKDHRRTLGSALVPEVKLDLQAEKARHEMEVAFENFENEPTFSQERAVQTPDPKKPSNKNLRRTLGNVLVHKVEIDLQAAKAEREIELAFENFQESTAVEVQRKAKTPDIKRQKRTMRLSLGYRKELDQSFDPRAFKVEKEDNAETMKSKNLTLRTISEDLKPDTEATKTTVEFVSSIESRDAKVTNKDDNITTDQERAETKESQNTMHEQTESEENEQLELSVKTTIVDTTKEKQKPVDTPEESRSLSKLQERSTRVRRTRQISADSAVTRRNSSDVVKPAVAVVSLKKAYSSEDMPSSIDVNELVRRGKMEDTITATQLDSTDIDSTEDEANLKPTKSRNRRLRKIATKTPVALTLEAESHHALEPIAEEEKRHSLESLAKKSNSEAECTDPVILGQESISTQESVGQAGMKPSLNLNADDDISMLDSNSDIDRREQLAMVESTDKVATSIDSLREEKKPAATQEEVCVVQVAKPTAEKPMVDDPEESIPSTPAQSKSRRRPSRNIEPPSQVLPALRRTRRGSVQDVIEEDVQDNVVVSAKRGRRVKSKTESIDNSTPARNKVEKFEMPVEKASETVLAANDMEIQTAPTDKTDVEKVQDVTEKVEVASEEVMISNKEALVSSLTTTNEDSSSPKDDTTQVSETPVVEANDEEIVPSTPVPTKTRRRQPQIKPKSLSSSQEISEPMKLPAKTASEVIQPISGPVKPAQSSDNKQTSINAITQTKVNNQLEGNDQIAESNVDEVLNHESQKPESIGVGTVPLEEKLNSGVAKQKTFTEDLPKDCLPQEQIKEIEVTKVDETDKPKAEPSTPLPSKTRGRKASVKQESATPVRKGTRRTTVEAVQPPQKEDASQDAEIKTDTDHVSESSANKNQELRETDDLESTALTEIVVCEDHENEEEDPEAKSVPLPPPTEQNSSIMPSKSENSGSELVDPGNKLSDSITNDHKSCAMSCKEPIVEPIGKEILTSETESSAEQNTKEEKLTEVLPHLPLPQEQTQEKDPKVGDIDEPNPEPSTTLLSKTRGRKASAKEESATPVRKVTRRKAISSVSSPQKENASQNVEVATDDVLSTPVPSTRRGRRAAVKAESVSESLASKSHQLRKEDEPEFTTVHEDDQKDEDDSKHSNLVLLSEQSSSKLPATTREETKPVPEPENSGSELIDTEKRPEQSINNDHTASNMTQDITDEQVKCNDPLEETNIEKVVITTLESSAVQVIIEEKDNEAPPQDSMLTQDQTQDRDETKVDETDDQKPEATSPVPLRTRGRKAVVKQESATPVRKATRRKAVEAQKLEESQEVAVLSTSMPTKKRGRRAAEKSEDVSGSSTNKNQELRKEEKPESAAGTDDNKDEGNFKDLIISNAVGVPSHIEQSSCEEAYTVPDSKNSESEPVNLEKSSAQSISNDHTAGDITAEDKTNEPVKHNDPLEEVDGKEVEHDTKEEKNSEDLLQESLPQEQTQEKDDVRVDDIDGEKIEPSTPVPLKTRGRRAIATQESATPVRKGTRRKAVDVIQPSQSHESQNVQIATDAILSTPIPPKKRGRRAAVKSGHISESTTNKTHEERKDDEPESRIVAEDDKKDERDAMKPPNPVDVSSSTDQSSADLPDKSANEETQPLTEFKSSVSVVEENVEELIISTQEIQKPPPIDARSVPLSEKRSRRGQVTKEENVAKTLPQDSASQEQIQSIDDETDGENIEPSTPVPSKIRGRRPVVKQESATPVRKGSRRKAIEVIPSPKKEDASQDVEIATDVVLSTPVPLKTRGRRPAAKAEKIQEIKKADGSADRPTIVAEVLVNENHKRDEEDLIEVTNPVAISSSTEQRSDKAISSSDDGEEIQNAVPPESEDPSSHVDNETENPTDIGKTLPSSPVPSKTRGRRAVPKREPETFSPERSTPARRGTRKKAEKDEFNVPEEVPSNSVPTKTRARRVVVKTEPSENEISTPIQKGGRRKAAEHKIDSDISVPADVESSATDEVEEIIQSTPVAKTRGRRPAQKPKVDESAELPNPSSKSGRRGADTDDVETVLSEVVQVSVKSEPITPEISTPAPKRGRQGAMKAEEKVITSKQRTRKVKIEFETLDDSTSIQVSESDTRKETSKITETTADSSLQAEKEDEANIEKPILTKKRGRVAAVKSEPVESTPECPSPIRKRGRRGAVEVDEPKEGQVLSRRGRPAKSKLEITTESIGQDLELNETEKETTTTTALSTSVSEEDHTQPEEKSQSRPTRGRKKTQSTKNGTTLESTLPTDEDEPASVTKPKVTRGRKAATKADTSSEKETTQEQTMKRGRKAIANDEVTQEESEEKVDKKPTRSRKVATIKAETTPQVASEPSPPPKKTARGKKASQAKASQKSDEEQLPAESHTKMSPKLDEKSAPKRLLRRQMAVSYDEDQDDTPSKRIRRKPNRLMSDEFVL